MPEAIQLSESVPCRGDFDVIVAGGGVAGIAAALAARRQGKKVLLIEKGVLLGGLATIGLINLFVPMCNGHGRQIIRGMAEELLRLSIRYGYDSIPEDWRNGEPEKPTMQRYCTKYSPQIFALALAELLNAEGIDLRFDSVVTLPVMDGAHCNGLVVESKSGREYFAARMVVDATGDADILYRAGVPTVQGKNYFTYTGHIISLESCSAAVAAGNIQKAIFRCYGGNATLYGKNHPAAMPLWDGVTAEEISRYLVLSQIETLQRIRGEDRISREIITLPGMAQFRTTRHIDGDYTLGVKDQYCHFEDSVGAICDFDQRGILYEIPYRALVRSGYDNLITAGRCASGEGYAWDVLRVIPPAILSGQAAGNAVSLALDLGRPIYDIDIAALQSSLEKDDVMIHFNDEWIKDADRDSASDSGVEHF